MAIRITKTRKRIKLQALGALIFICVLLTYFVTSVALRSINVSLSVQIQNKKNTLIQMETDNRNLSKEIQRLSEYERVMAIAKEAGLSLNDNNVIKFKSGE